MNYYLVKNATPSEISNSTVNTVFVVDSDTYHILLPLGLLSYADYEQFTEYDYLLISQSENPDSLIKGRHSNLKRQVYKTVSERIEYRFMVENVLTDKLVNAQLLKKLTTAFTSSHDGLLDLAYIEIQSTVVDAIFTQALKDSLVAIMEDELKFFPWMLPSVTY